jgi:integrase
MGLYRRGKIWWFSFEFEGRKIQESTKMRNKDCARDVEAKRRTDLIERRAGFKKTKLAPKFEEYVTKFLAWSKLHHKPKTWELHNTNCDTLLRFFRGCWLDEITRDMIEDFKLARAGEARRNAKDGSIVSPATVNRALTTLKKLFNEAEGCNYGISSPMRKFELLTEDDGRTRVVSFGEEVGYLAAASQPLKDIAQIILDTGMRPEEVFRIRVENLDFAARTIFNPFGKTKAARRKVTMTADVLELLKRRATKAKGGFVFPSRSDPDRQIGSVRKAHDAAVEKAGIREHFRLYDLRHTFATRAVTAGVDLPTLGAILGHTTVQMTMRYVHPFEEQKCVAAGKLEGYRLAGILEAIEKSRGATTVSTTVN